MTPASVGETRGRVLHDATGMPGVAVSDGRVVVTTGSDGSYSLPGHGPFVFLTQPSGYRAEAWFHPAADEVDFELVTEEQPVPFTFVQVTDLHLSLGETAFGPGAGDATIWFDEAGMHDRIVTTPTVLEALFHEVTAHRPRFVVATGDLTNNGTEEEYSTLVGALAGSPVPVRPIPGNHDHHAGEADLAAGRALPWERHVGPRWYSFDHAGLHFAAIDWFTHLLDVDRDVQEAWLAADLAAVEAGMPTVLLTHDQMSSDFYRRLPARPIASFSGHWHTTRAVALDGTRHYNTATATFGGLDYSPASYRVCTWDGDRLAVTTVARGPERLAGATFRSSREQATNTGWHWSAALDGGAHLAGPVVAGEVVLAVSKDEDVPRGSLVGFDAATGERRWTVELGTGVKASPLVIGDLAVVASASGEVVGVDVASGTARWRTHLADPLLLWVYLRPATDGRRAFVGDVARFSCLDLDDGSVVWSRTDLGQRENLTSFAHPAMVDGVLLVAFAGQLPDLWGLDPATGSTIWPRDVEPGSMYRRPDHELVVHLPRIVVAGITPDPDGAEAYVVRLGSRLERLRAGDGTSVWSSPLTGWFNPAAPVVQGDAVVALSSMGEVHCLDRATGARRWQTAVGGDSPIAMGSYRAGGPALLASPTPVGDRLLVPGADGRITTLAIGDGTVLAAIETGTPIAAPVAVDETTGLCIVAGVDGHLRAIELVTLAAASPVTAERRPGQPRD